MTRTRKSVSYRFNETTMKSTKTKNKTNKQPIISQPFFCFFYIKKVNQGTQTFNKILWYWKIKNSTSKDNSSLISKNLMNKVYNWEGMN